MKTYKITIEKEIKDLDWKSEAIINKIKKCISIGKESEIQPGICRRSLHWFDIWSDPLWFSSEKEDWTTKSWWINYAKKQLNQSVKNPKAIEVLLYYGFNEYGRIGLKAFSDHIKFIDHDPEDWYGVLSYLYSNSNEARQFITNDNEDWFVQLLLLKRNDKVAQKKFISRFKSEFHYLIEDENIKIKIPDDIFLTGLRALGIEKYASFDSMGDMILLRKILNETAINLSLRELKMYGSDIVRCSICFRWFEILQKLEKNENFENFIYSKNSGIIDFVLGWSLSRPNETAMKISSLAMRGHISPYTIGSIAGAIAWFRIKQAHEDTGGENMG